MPKKKTTKVITSLITASFLVTGASYSYIEAAEVSDSETYQQTNIDTEANNLESELNAYLTLIEQMPDEVANQGANSGVKWLNENKGENYKGFHFINENNNLKLVQDTKTAQFRASWGACISAVGVAIASNAIPWAKILKVKKAAKAVGGIQKLTKNVKRAYKHQRNLGLSKRKAIKKAASVTTRAFPKATRSAVIEFFSLGGLSSCF